MRGITKIVVFSASSSSHGRWRRCRYRWIHTGLLVRSSWRWYTVRSVCWVPLVVSVIESLLKHTIIVSNNCG